MKKIKRVIAMLLIAAMIVPTMPQTVVKAADVNEVAENVEEDVQLNEEAVVTEEIPEVKKEAKTVESEVAHLVDHVEIEEIKIIEETSGYWETEWDENDEEVKYFRYYFDPEYAVVLKDGTRLEVNEEWGEIYYDDEFYSLYITGGNQSYDNQWGVGKHTVEAEIMGFKTSFVVEIIETPVESIVFKEQSLIEKTSGYYNDENPEEEWYQYSYAVDFDVHLKDGSVIETDYTEYVEYEGKNYYLSYDDGQDYDNQWGVGKHTVEAEILGFKTSFEVEILESPVKSIVCEDVQVIELVDGNYTEDYWDTGEEYFKYRYTPKYTITFKDGTVIESDSNGDIEYQDTWYEPRCKDDQSADNQWDLGKHTVTADFMGYEFSFTVEVVDSIVDHVEFQDIQVIESSGYNCEDEDGNQWYEYSYLVKYKVYLKNGKTLESDYDEDVYYNGRYYRLQYDDGQSFENQWGIGKYTIEAEVLGYKTSFTVEVVESPVESIVYEDLSVIKNLDGYYEEDWYTEEEYFYYKYTPKYTVTLKDGTTLKSDSDGDIYYKDEWYSPNLRDNQNYENQWDLGKYTVTAELFGTVGSFEVEVIDTPIDYIEFDENTIIEKSSGWYVGEDEEWFKYYYHIDCKVHLKDGRVLIPDEFDEIKYNGRWYEIEYSDDQSYDNPWGIGSHEVTASVLGYETTFTIEIVESPVKKVVYEDVKVIKTADGYYEEWEEGERYFFYEYQPQYTVTFKDGTVMKSDEGCIYYQNERYSPECRDNQSFENEWDLGKHVVHANLLGYETTFNVEVIKVPIKKYEVVTRSLIELTDGYYDEDWDTGEECFWYDYDECVKYIITLETGEVLESDNDGTVYYNGRYYSVRTSDDQSFETPWGVGKHTVTASLFGNDMEFEIEVIESPVATAKIDKVKVNKHEDGYWDEDYDEDTDDYLEWYHYEAEPKSYTVTLKDGTVLKSDYRGRLKYQGQYYWPEVIDEQSYENQLQVGINTLQVQLLGKVFDFEVEVVDNECESIEILEVTPLTGNDVEYSYDNITIYRIPAFSYKITMKDGSSFTGIYDEYYENEVRVYSYQEDEPWEIGKENSFVCRYGNVEVEVPVEILEDVPFAYIEQNEGIYITRATSEDRVIQIPEEINGKPVVGVLGLGYLEETEELVIPDSVEVLGDKLARDAYSVKKVSIGSGVKNMKDAMFGTFYNLEQIEVSEDNPYYCDINGIVYDKAGKTLVVYPLGIEGDYNVPASVTNVDVFNAHWDSGKLVIPANSKAFVTKDNVTYTADMKKIVYVNRDISGTYVMPSTVTQIADKAFENCTTLTSVTVSSAVTDIAYAAFADCTLLESVSLPNSVKTIGKDAFSRCENLDTVNFPTSLQSIGDEGFYRTGLTALTIPNSVKTLGTGAFQSCKQLKTVVIGSGIDYIPDYAFQNCSNLTSAELKNSSVFVGAHAFAYTSLNSINVENIIECISEGTFMSTNLKNVTFGNTVTDIAYNSFRGCTNLNNVDLPDSLVSINRYSGLKGTANATGEVYIENVLYSYEPENSSPVELNVKAGTTIIADYALEYASNIEKITLPEGIKRIGNAALIGCSGLKEIEIPASVTYIGADAFLDCYELEAINVKSSNKNYKSIDGVLFNKDCTELIWCPKRADDTYEIPETVELVRMGAFGTSGVKNLIIRNDDIVLEEQSVGYNLSYSSESDKRYHLNVYCNKDSAAYAYAKANLLTYIDLSEIEEKPELTSAVAKVHNGHTYVLYDIDSENEELFKSWTKAKEYCESVGGYLVTITSAEEQMAVTELLKSAKGGRYWIGATDDAEEGVWKWVTDEAFSYSNWRDGEPNNVDSAEHYGEIRVKNSQWVDVAETMVDGEGKPQNGFICELNNVKNPFVDITDSNYYYDAVLWALDKNITQGKDATHFQPTAECTRAQVVTFLWRSQGCPEPKTTKNPFVDVPDGTYYTKAVLWALENGITAGKDATHFQPDVTVNRSQFVTFLWRAEGQPKPSIKNPFVDVPNGTYYTDAVLWAFENGITSGKDATHFQPTSGCQRCQVVTFLYRAYK